MSSGLMFDDIIKDIISDNKLAHPTEENYCLFTQIENNIIYIYRGSHEGFYWKKGTYECLEVPCLHLNFKKLK